MCRLITVNLVINVKRMVDLARLRKMATPSVDPSARTIGASTQADAFVIAQVSMLNPGRSGAGPGEKVQLVPGAPGACNAVRPGPAGADGRAGERRHAGRLSRRAAGRSPPSRWPGAAPAAAFTAVQGYVGR